MAWATCFPVPLTCAVVTPNDDSSASDAWVNDLSTTREATDNQLFAKTSFRSVYMVRAWNIDGWDTVTISGTIQFPNNQLGNVTDGPLSPPYEFEIVASSTPTERDIGKSIVPNSTPTAIPSSAGLNDDGELGNFAPVAAYGNAGSFNLPFGGEYTYTAVVDTVYNATTEATEDVTMSVEATVSVRPGNIRIDSDYYSIVEVEITATLYPENPADSFPLLQKGDGGNDWITDAYGDDPLYWNVGFVTATTQGDTSDSGLSGTICGEVEVVSIGGDTRKPKLYCPEAAGGSTTLFNASASGPPWPGTTWSVAAFAELSVVVTGIYKPTMPSPL